jgi:hypothetical protein
MLKRPDDTPPDRHRRFRQRQRNGIACTTVEYTAEVLDLLVRTGWLTKLEAADRAVVGAAISRMVSEAARR